MNTRIVRRRLLKGVVLFVGGLTIGRLGWLDRQVGQFRRRWEEHNVATLDRVRRAEGNGDAFLLVALGDSSTQGIGADTIDQGYVPLLAALIEAHLDRPVEVINLSISGATVETVLVNQVSLLAGLGLTPDLVVFNIGGNDVGVKGIDGDVFRAHLRTVLDQLPTQTIVGNIPSFSFLPSDDKAKELSSILDQEAPGPVVDLRTLTEGFSAAEYLVRYHAADLFHPNSRAYAAWAELFFAAWVGDAERPMPTAWQLSNR